MFFGSASRAIGRCKMGGPARARANPAKRFLRLDSWTLAEVEKRAIVVRASGWQLASLSVRQNSQEFCGCYLNFRTGPHT